MQTITDTMSARRNGAMRDTTRERNADIMRRFDRAAKLLSAQGAVSREELLRLVSSNPPGGYYVSFRHALRRIEMLRTAPQSTLRWGKRAYWLELAARVERQLQRHPSLNRSQALARVLAAGRPSTDCLTDEYLWRIYTDNGGVAAVRRTPRKRHPDIIYRS